MKPESKSIFTSQTDFSAQSTRERTTPPETPSTPSSNPPPSPNTTLEGGIEREAGLPTRLQRREKSTRKYSSQNTSQPVGDSESQFRKPDPTPSTPNTSNASKHPRSEDSRSRAVSTSTSERPSKRNRPRLRPRHTLDPEDFQAAKKLATPILPHLPSPLFFSHTPRQRPILPPNPTTSDLAATMLNKARDEIGVTTLKLARGSLSNATSPPRSTSNFSGSWASSSTPRTPDTRTKSPGMQILGSVGIVELLEQDERPTFIIDVANPVNFRPGGLLQIVFANASLRAHDSIFDLITGKESQENPGIVNDFPEFKTWALSFVKNNESLDICLPSFSYGGLVWTCSTLRKRLRIISGSGNSIATGAGSSSGEHSNSSAFSERTRGALLLSTTRSPLAQTSELGDYFGDTIPDAIFNNAPLQHLASPMTIDDLVPSKQTMIASQGEVLSSEMILTNFPDTSSFDWTRLPLSAALPKHIQFARSIDWASTALGPIEDWSFDLRAMCNLIMGSPHPAAMYWGDDYTIIYNEAYIMLAGQKHPYLMGKSYRTAWAEIWPEIEDVFARAMESGQSTMKDDDCLFMRRNGYLEESYFSWSIVPLVGEDGSVVGLYNPSFEKTRRKIAERRMLTLREIGDKTAVARELNGFWGQVIKGLEYNEYDIPFAFLYSVTDDFESDQSSMQSGSLAASPSCVLEGTIRVPEGHKASVSPLDLKTSEEGFAPYLRESMKTDRPVLLTTEEGTLSSELIEGLEWRGFGDPCRAAVVCPIHPTTGESILGFLVMGVNPRRPYDDDYSLFVQLLSRQLATSMASVVLFEEEIRRGQRAARLAALDRQELSKQLDLRTQEKVESETKFTRMAEFAPVGMFIANSTGQITYSNDTWWEISRHPRTSSSADMWMDSIKAEDRAEVENIWKTLVDSKTAVTHEFRFKTPWEDRNGNMGDTWVLMSAYPEKDGNGQLKSVFGSITNISSQKSAEDFQKRRTDEAIELKRQQENFIDMTSHEMRNPLSAILQCSDEISASITEYKSDNDVVLGQRLREILDGSVDAAQTIALCAQHQKRIVDDILTLSKLDSALLVVTPVDVQPVAVVQRALKMFAGELDTNDIAMEFRMDKSYLDLDVDHVKLDPSRLLQVLINLTTNAIKFTHTQEKRTITVSVAASKERPDGSECGVTYFPSRSNRKDLLTEDSEWGTGETIYLQFAVQDTGRGLDEKEKTLLFQRFRQASPRTHVQYGGSGLGLFISRELTELQGGEIGVTSERGVGSTFAFYVKARRVDRVPDAATNSMRRHSSHTAIVIESRRNSSGKAIQHSNTNSQRLSSPIIPPSSPKLSPSLLDFTKIQVLIVEDNLVNQRVLQKQLKNIGFTTVVANHGGEALDVLKTSRFWTGHEKDGVDLALILMDLEMPVMDGLTCAKTIRDYEANGTIVRHVPIIAVTANARLEQIETAIAAGMDDVVSKPFRIPELIPKIEELITKSIATTRTG
ncbi:Hybrid signal transduction histidine kinase K [Lachnellula willkommii]|uniref:Hybrid signal transduction histidine kinase K n=1 Tax=Lachnellula willkommii TaxID=215461 RepID=A0A559MH37_9HELO|nr:Hybrid signal transduction histidine kinase K [Lachnellula willkommii]